MSVSAGPKEAALARPGAQETAMRSPPAVRGAAARAGRPRRPRGGWPVAAAVRAAVRGGGSVSRTQVPVPSVLSSLHWRTVVLSTMRSCPAMRPLALSCRPTRSVPGTSRQAQKHWQSSAARRLAAVPGRGRGSPEPVPSGALRMRRRTGGGPRRADGGEPGGPRRAFFCTATQDADAPLFLQMHLHGCGGRVSEPPDRVYLPYRIMGGIHPWMPGPRAQPMPPKHLDLTSSD